MKKQRGRALRSRAGQGAAPATEAVAEAYERFARYVQSAASYEDAAATARANRRSAIEEVARLACGLDLIKVVSSVRVAMIINRTVTGVDVSAAVLELVALVLACRDFAASEPVAVAPRSGFMPPHVEAAAWRALAAGSMIALFDSPPSDAESAILFYSVQREITLRNPVYPHTLLNTLHGLFRDPAVNDDCRAVLGFAGLEAVHVMEAVRSLAIREMAERFTRMETARDASLPFILSWRDDQTGTSPPTEEQRAAMQEVFEAVQGLTTLIDQATVIDPDAVVQHTGYERSTVEAVVDTFTLTGLTDIEETLDRFFRGTTPYARSRSSPTRRGDGCSSTTR